MKLGKIAVISNIKQNHVQEVIHVYGKNFSHPLLLANLYMGT